ncbi:MAG: restriction endonuclease subunit S [Gracilimonas sp.]|uniref:restriction endonuclease subunit S n=1 Tax=Gracilimonas sp. TaxID=1974203 RepID=UPI001B1335F4|nr:restriction endonuclease subunit S [Gracilimonas sp.]MBO6584747.1 restriction endonuclease subunit S [Gracilimonas sp.]MBO6615982.1 restriction endonuclease subunit S [Gracilimonas sp.]
MVSNKKYIGPEIKNTPEGWSVAPLGECIKGNGRYGINESASDYDPQKPRYLRITDIDDYGNLKQDGEKSVDSEDYAKYLLEEGEIVFARTGNTVGKTYLHKEENGKLVYAGYLIKFEPDPNIIRPKFLKLYTDTAFYRNWIQAISQRSGQPGVNSKEYRRMPILLPPIKEQDLILEVINAWDKAISKVQKLIQAKKQYKKGLMQRLLAGKVRFPEFEGEDWVEVKLGEVFDRVTEKNESESVKNVLTISAQDGLVSQTDYYNKSVASKDLSNYIVLRQGDFAYNKSYSEGYPLGAIKRLHDYEKGVLSPLYICFKLASDNVDSDFITHFFEYGGLDHGIYKIAREGARNHGLLNVSVKEFFEINLTLPQYKEQKKIASILNEAMSEIELLEEQLEKYQQQKKGLMQQLLTGKVRVKV